MRKDDDLVWPGCFLIAVAVLFVFSLISSLGTGDWSRWEDNPRGAFGTAVIGLFGLLFLFILLIGLLARLFGGHRSDSEPDKPESHEVAKRDEKKKYEAW